jgi:hypothetical protein
LIYVSLKAKKNRERHLRINIGPRSKYNLLTNKNLIIHNLTKSDDNRSYACVINNQIDNNTRQSHFKSLRVRGKHSKF